jgi:hypothetical protein
LAKPAHLSEKTVKSVRRTTSRFRHSQRWLPDALERRCLLSAAISFANHVEFSSGTSPDAIVAADFNNDGDTDLAVADSVLDQVSIYYGNGQGAFTPGPVLKVSGSPSALVAGDFNNDGSIGLAVGCSPGIVNTGTTVTVFNNNAGIFSLGQTTTVFTGATANEPIALASGFFNNDAFLDLAATEYSGNAVAILLGQGNGTFQTPVPYNVDNNPTAIVAADLNGDGTVDLAVADTDTIVNSDMTTSPVNVLTFLSGKGDGTFTVTARQQVPTTAADVLTTADLNNDGKPDLIVGSADSTGAAFLNNGKFQFTESANFALAGPGAGIAAGDFNFDGDADVVVANGAATNGTNEVTIATGAGDGSFSTFGDAATGLDPVAVAVGDFNNDGKSDLAIADEAGGQVSILLNNTVGTVLKPTTTTLQSSDTSVPYGQPVQFTATVATSGTGADIGTPVGSVEFFGGIHLLDTETLGDTGSALFSTSSLNVGNNQIYAQYIGDSTFAASTSNSVEQTITPSSGHGPDLVGSFVSSTVPPVVVPGRKAIVKIRVTNQGNTTATGTITNDIYLSLDDTLDPSDILVPLTGQLAQPKVKLRPGQSMVLTGVLAIPTDAPNGDYILLADINDTQTLLESDYSNNIAVSPSTTADVDEFGAIGGRQSAILTLPDADGTAVTYKLAGPGTGTVAVGDDGIDVSLTGTTAASSLTITAAGGNGFADLNSISSNGPLASITAPKADLATSLTLAGAARKIVLNNVGTAEQNNTITLGPGAPATISLGNVVSTTLVASSGIDSLTVGNFTTSSKAPPSGFGPIAAYNSQIAAPWIGSLISKGDFETPLSLSGAGAPGGVALRQATIHDIPSNLSWVVTGSVGKVAIASASPPSGSPGLTLIATGQLGSFSDAGNFAGLLSASDIGSVTIDGNLNGNILAGDNLADQTFGAGSINSLKVTGSVSSSLITAGLSNDVLPVDDSSETLIPGGRIKSLFIGGPVDSSSRFLADSLPPKVQIGGTTVTPAADPLFQI